MFSLSPSKPGSSGDPRPPSSICSSEAERLSLLVSISAFKMSFLFFKEPKVYPVHLFYFIFLMVGCIIYLFIYLIFIFGCVGSSFLCEGLL